MSAALAVQIALRTILVADTATVALVPATSIFDRAKLPEAFPCIVLGESQEVADDLTLDRKHVRVFSNIHLWVREPSLEIVKSIAGSIRRAVAGIKPALTDGVCVDQRFHDAKFMRDPDGVTAHGIVTIETLVELT